MADSQNPLSERCLQTFYRTIANAVRGLSCFWWKKEKKRKKSLHLNNRCVTAQGRDISESVLPKPNNSLVWLVLVSKCRLVLAQFGCKTSWSLEMMSLTNQYGGPQSSIKCSLRKHMQIHTQKGEQFDKACVAVIAQVFPAGHLKVMNLAGTWC